MANPTYLPGNLQWLGLAKETTYGTPAATPTYWIPVDTPVWKPIITPLTDNALRGMMATEYGQAQGMRHDELTYKTFIFPDSVFPHLLAALGTPDAGSTALTATTANTPTTASTGGTLAAATYYYKVTATVTNGESAASNEVSIATTGSTSTVTVTWTSVSGATGYNIYRSTAAGSEVLLASVGNVTTYTDNGSATPGTKTAPATAAYKHATSLYNGSGSNNAQPPSYTGFLYQADGNVMQIPGMVISDLKFTIKADTLPTIDVQWMGLPGKPIAAPSNTPSTLPPMPPFTAAISLGGAQLNEYSDITIDIKRGTQAIPVLNGTQSPLAIYGGPLTVTGTLGAIYQGTSDVNLQDLLTNTQPALVLSINPQADAAHPLAIQMSKIAFDTAEPQGSNTAWMTLNSNFKALANSTDALDSKLSPVQASLTNASATAY